MTLSTLWLIFAAVFAIAFCVDMLASSRRKGEVKPGTALAWTGLWISLALGYAATIFLLYPQDPGQSFGPGRDMAFKFLSGYLTEYSLSVDNLFVFIMIFSLMGVSAANQPRLLKLGILLSIALRAGFILLGMGLVEKLHWIVFVFGAVLLWTAYKMSFGDSEEEIDPEGNILYRAATRILPLHPDQHHPRFFPRHEGRLHMTKVFLVFLVIGSTDLLFAFDSIPAIIGVIKEGGGLALSLAQEDFIAVTSNLFAVMGLVSLFFVLKRFVDRFWCLQYGVSLVLCFIGLKMLLSWVPAVSSFFRSHSWVSLAFIVLALAGSALLSNLIPKPVVGEREGEETEARVS